MTKQAIGCERSPVDIEFICYPITLCFSFLDKSVVLKFHIEIHIEYVITITNVIASMT